MQEKKHFFDHAMKQKKTNKTTLKRLCTKSNEPASQISMHLYLITLRISKKVNAENNLNFNLISSHSNCLLPFRNFRLSSQRFHCFSMQKMKVEKTKELAFKNLSSYGSCFHDKSHWKNDSFSFSLTLQEELPNESLLEVFA